MIYTDEEIIAYVNGKLDARDRKKFEEQIESDILLQKRVDVMTAKFGKMKSEYEDLLAQAPATPDFLNAPHPASKAANENKRTPLSRIAASCAALIAAGVIGYGLAFTYHKPASANWMEYVAAYQALYATPTLAHITPDATRENAEITRVSASLGKTFDRESLGGTQQIDYKRAQILSYQGRPLIQFTYLSKLGAPIALCVIKSDGSKDATPTYSVMEDQQTASWSKNGYEYILIGGKDRSIIKTASEQFYKKL